MKNIFLPIQYIAYLFKARGAHGIHSPFVYELYHKVVKDKTEFYDFAPIEHLRERLHHSKEVIEVVDFGAVGNSKYNKKVKDIAKRSAIPAKEGRLLFRLVNFMQPRNMVEMGTSLGISTLYQHKACLEANMITMEGSPGTSSYAGVNFRIMKADSINRVVGDFKETLPEVIKSLPLIDYVFFDGNHRKEATMEYFHKFLPLVSDRCVFVFDDIRWSTDMYEAWKEIIEESSATVTVDLFSFGLVFFNPTQVKQHFVLRY